MQRMVVAAGWTTSLSSGRSTAVRARPNPGHKIYPYLLRGLAITRPNQVWAMDITYIAMARGFVYLTVVLDWFSRRVLAWRPSETPLSDAENLFREPDHYTVLASLPVSKAFR
jgi:transposase InsO family protein